MKVSSWLMNSRRVRLWIAAHPEDSWDSANSSNIKAIELSMELGDNADHDDLRSTYWTAIRSMGSVVEGFPITRRMNKANGPSWVSHEDICEAVLQRINTEGVKTEHGLVNGMQSIVNDMDVVGEKLLQLKKNGQWSGQILDGVPVINPKKLQ